MQKSAFMKKITVLIIMCVCIIFANAQEYTKFMGISMDKPSSDFENMLLSKGFKHGDTYNDGKLINRLFYGPYEDIQEVCITVDENIQTHKIEYIGIMINSEVCDTVSATFLYKKMYQSLKQQYGDISSFIKSVEEYEFILQKYSLWFNEDRICLGCLKLDYKSVKGLSPDEYLYVIDACFWPLPQREE